MTDSYSIRRRLLVVLGLAISVATLIQAGIAYRVALREVDDISDYHMVQIAFAVRRGMPEPAGPQLEHRPISGEDQSFSLLISPLPMQSEAARELTRGFSTRQVGDKHFRIFTLPTQTRLIEVMHDEAVRGSNASKLALRTVLPILILGPVLMLIVWWVISRALRPLITSRREIARRDANDLHALQTHGVPDELLPFILEINVLFERIGKAFQAQQNFVADAAHELRSPLAALRLQVQGLQRATSTEARNIAAERVMSGIDRATRLIEQMLVLAREEATEPDKTLCDLPQIVRNALSDILLQAQARNIDIGANLTDTTPDDCFIVQGNAEALRILLRNLLENAVKYTPPYGIVNLSVVNAGPNIVLSVEDSGPGIPPEEHTRIFERFRRGREHDEGSSGLGMSIVQAIARRHRIRIVLGQSAQLGGLSVTLTFPGGPASSGR
jgi:two-component system OmpR family sensor kinase